MGIKKLLSALKIGEDKVYPLTTADQVIKKDGSRLETFEGVNADTLGGKYPGYYKVAHNLLDNSDFTNPVNQREYVSGNTVEGHATFIDRWRCSKDAAAFTLSNDGIGTPVYIYQIIDAKGKYVGKRLTAAVGLADGSIHVASGVSKSVSTWTEIEDNDNDKVHVQIADRADGYIEFIVKGKTHPVKWAALYEGDYTVETLPAYIPKGYNHELLECKKYFERLKSVFIESGTYACFGTGCFTAANTFIGVINVMPKRGASNVTFNGNFRIRNNSQYVVTAIETNDTLCTNSAIYVKATVSGATAGYGGVLQANNDPNAYIDISSSL